ncbi:MAG: tRNA (N(6)-L-threonylcarbamoyladenosine(37)-C(2))-methylthiotransferase MtaB [Brevinematales bacterium]|nr:tRNA (N(6)-L-threonylcarbamoyladenosine(37)-C(2))-methylthiotransferase MtaB [Brevinematales bacterium]
MKVALITVGCKLNQCESSALSQRLKESGLEVVHEMEEADLVIVNTCTVTNTADSKSRSYMKQAKKLGKRVVVTGCYATTDGEEIQRRGLADMVVPNEEKFTLPSLLLESFVGEKEDFPLVVEYERTRAYVKIQDGCNRFCSYCKIPYGRGRSRSLVAEEVIRRAKNLVERGYREIVLTGVNISDYKDGEKGLSALVQELVALSGEYRVRLSSLQPDQWEDGLLEVLSHPKMTPHLHLSLQSGSDTVLERMRRRYRVEDFRQLCARIRETRQDVSLTTDIIVGFPGETDEEFEQTKRLVQHVAFSRVHLFSYSPRAGTWAATQKQLSEEVKKARLHDLERVVLSTAEKWVKDTLLGREATVLVEEHDGEFSYGYTEHYLYTKIQGVFAPNTFVSVVPCDTWVYQGAISLRAEKS